ncbi:MAG: hypothetical protein V7739_20190 [Motiliproteus sp.]
MIKKIIRLLAVIFLSTISSLSFGEITEDWDVVDGALTTGWSSPSMDSWLAVLTQINKDLNGIVFYIHPKNKLEICMYGYSEDPTTTILIVNDKMIESITACAKDDSGNTVYYTYPSSSVEQDKIIETFKKSSKVKISHPAASFEVSAMGFTKAWNKIKESKSSEESEYFCIAVEENGEKLYKHQSMIDAGPKTPKLAIQKNRLVFYIANEHTDSHTKILYDDLFKDYTTDNNETESHLRSAFDDVLKFSYKLRDIKNIIYFPILNNQIAVHKDGYTPVFHRLSTQDNITNIIYECRTEFTPIVETNYKFNRLSDFQRRLVQIDFDYSPTVWGSTALSVIAEKEVIKVAHHGNLQAIMLLATSFEYGVNGFSLNYDDAYYWYNELLKTDKKTNAYFGLASMYSEGKGRSKDLVKAQGFINGLLDKINSHSSNKKKHRSLGRLYAHGNTFLNKEVLKHIEFVAKKANSGNTDYQESIIKGYGDILQRAGIAKSSFLHSVFVKLSPKQKRFIGDELKYWHKKSVSDNNLKGMYLYAVYLNNGIYPYDENPRKSLNIFNQISEQCDLDNNSWTSVNAANAIAEFYGPSGQMRNYRESYKWTNISSFMGEYDSTVKANIEELEKLMSSELINQAQADSKIWLDKYCN